MRNYIIDVKPLDDFILLITFSNNELKKFDLKPYLDIGVFRELRDRSVFNSVRVSFDTIEWNNGADFCPEVLYDESIPV